MPAPLTKHAVRPARGGEITARREVADAAAWQSPAERKTAARMKSAMSGYYRRLDTLGIHLGGRFRA